jgi:hypothetical protein
LPEREPVGGLHPLAGLRNGNNRSRQGNADFRKLAGARLDLSRPAVLLTIMSWLMESPSPVPSPAGFVVKNGSNIFSFTPATYRLSYAVS